MMNWRQHPWAGVFPAALCALRDDESLDEEGLRSHFADLAAVEGVKGIVCNGHTGEIMSLRPRERAHVTRLLAETVRGSNGRSVKAISGVSAEGSLEATDDALAAKEAGADAILLMPPHHWLRFGRSSRTAIGFFEDVAAAGIPIIIHQYPAWTKAGYTLTELLEMVKIPQVVMIKMGTRDMTRWRHDYECLKAAAPQIPVVTCHDEFLLATLLEGADGALVGFASLVPELIVEIVHSALDGDLPRARKAQRVLGPLARLIYHFGEPGCEAHQRMKTCRWLMGKFPNSCFRRPVRPLPPEDIERLGRELAALGFDCPRLGLVGRLGEPRKRPEAAASLDAAPVLA